MFALTGLDGTRILIAVGSIDRFKSIDFIRPDVGTKVDYASESLATSELAEALAARVGGAIPLLRCRLRANDAPVWINARRVSWVRQSLPINGPGTEMSVGGRYQHVVDDYEAVVAEIERMNVS